MTTSDREVAEQIVDRLNELLRENYEPSLCDAFERFTVDAIIAALTTARQEQAERVWKEASDVVAKATGGEMTHAKKEFRFVVFKALEAAAIRVAAKEGKQ